MVLTFQFHCFGLVKVTESLPDINDTFGAGSWFKIIAPPKTGKAEPVNWVDSIIKKKKKQFT